MNEGKRCFVCPARRSLSLARSGMKSPGRSKAMGSTTTSAKTPACFRFRTLPRPQPSWTLTSIRVRSKTRHSALVVGRNVAFLTSLDSYWFSCWSDAGDSYCHDSAGYALSTSCTDRGCSSHYGSDGSDLLMDRRHAARSSRQHDGLGLSLFAKDHRLLWKYEGFAGDWHIDLGHYSRCDKKFGSGGACKRPKTLLE